jgi:radical SAM protein with 4Fe4S-binding SPASM domain
VLTLETLKEILDNFPNAKFVKLQGMGEPLLNKNIPELLDELERRDIAIELFSNGTVFTEKLASQILSHKKLTFRFSLDASYKELFEKIRQGGDFDLITGNIRKLIKLRGSKKEPVISIWAVVTKETVDDIYNLIIKVKELGADYLDLQMFITDWGKQDLKQQIDKLKQPINNDLITEIKKTAGAYNLKVNIKTENFFTPKNKCSAPFTTTYISVKGDVIPCCILADADTIKMGNVLENNFKNIWNNEKYITLRKHIKEHKLDEFCKNCYLQEYRS